MESGVNGKWRQHFLIVQHPTHFWALSKYPAKKLCHILKSFFYVDDIVDSELYFLFKCGISFYSGTFKNGLKCTQFWTINYIQGPGKALVV